MPLTPQKAAAVLRKVEEVAGKHKVEGRLDYRHTSGKNWSPYERYLLSNGHTVFVNLAVDPFTATVSEKPAPASSPSVKKFWGIQKRREERAARKEERQAKKAERAAKPKVEPKARKPRVVTKPTPKVKADLPPVPPPSGPDAKGWSEAELAWIASYQESTGSSRPNAIKQLRNGQKKTDDKLVHNVVKAASESTPEPRKVHDPLAQATPVTA